MQLVDAVRLFEDGCSHQCSNCPLSKEDEDGLSACAHLNRAEALVYTQKDGSSISHRAKEI